MNNKRLEITSPKIAPLQCPTCKGPVGFAETNSTKYFFLFSLLLIPKIFEDLTISSIKLVQKIGLNLIFIKPGFATFTFSIKSSLSLIIKAKVSAKSNGFFLFILDKTIATFVEISQLNLIGGISVLIPSKLSGKVILSFLDKSNKIFFILSK